jgi:hypothetical protein
VRFIDDHELWTGPQKLAAAALALDVIEADDGVGVRRKDALGLR